MHIRSTLKAPSDRTLNRLIRGAILVLIVGIPLIGVIYFMDRWVPAGPTLAQRQVASLENAVRANPNNLGIRLQLAGAYTASNRYADALQQFDEALKADPKNRTAFLGRADVLRLSGDLAGAASGYQAVVDAAKGGEFAPVDTELQRAYYQLGWIALEQGRPADAIPLLTEAQKINKTDSDTLNLLGGAYFRTGAYGKAVDALRKAVLFVPTGWPEPYALLSQAYAKLGQADESEWAAAMADVVVKESGQAADRLASLTSRLASLTSGPAALDALTGLGLLSELQGDRSAAASWYRQVLARDANNFNAQVGLARVTAPTSSGVSQPSLPAASPSVGGNE
jgi:tetratricopeptide (TPR) repeat protein